MFGTFIIAAPVTFWTCPKCGQPGVIEPEPLDVSQTVAVVLGARNEIRLLRLEKALIENAVAHVAIRETEGPHAGHLMAIGLLPAPKKEVEGHLREFHMIRECLGTFPYEGGEPIGAF